MKISRLPEQHYSRLLERDASYDDLFFVGVKTTGVFCQPSCPARKPKLENCEFFSNAEEALLAAYRPCKRCKPLSNPHQLPEEVGRLVEAVEDQPEKRWKNQDFQELSTSAKQACRLFKKRFGMTFVAYARAKRVGIAMKAIKEKGSVIGAQLEIGYESGSGFRDAFSRTMGACPASSDAMDPLYASWIDTRLGPMLAIADEEALYLLEFVDRRGLEREIERLRAKRSSAIIPGKTAPIASIEKELGKYFNGEQLTFQTPIKMGGSPFQCRVWEELQKIPPGTTCAYTDVAKAVGRKDAVRAVAGANGANQLAIIIPCHRVRNADGSLAGYGGGVARKQWLIDHEKR